MGSLWSLGTWSNSELMNTCSLWCRGRGPQHLMFETKGNSEMLGILCHQVNNLRPLFRSKNQSPPALIWGPWELQRDECAPQSYLEVGGNRMKLRKTLQCHSYLCSMIRSFNECSPQTKTLLVRQRQWVNFAFIGKKLLELCFCFCFFKEQKNLEYV